MDGPSILRKSCDIYRDNVAVTFEGCSQTYAQLWERSCRLANALRASGLRPGDRVAILGDNQFETLEQVAGIALAGMVRSPMYTQNPADVNAYLLNLIGARVCLVQEKFAADLREAVRDEVPSLERIVVIGDEYEQFLASASADDPGVTVDQDDDHIIRFSAGTTGRPKGILHSVRGWMGMGNELAIILPRIEETDSYIAAGPLSHAAGLFIWPLLAHGARHVVMPAFDPVAFLDLVERERGTMALLVPTMIQMIASVPGSTERDLSSLRAIFYGAAPITETTLEAGLALWGNIMYQLYGQSESLPTTVLPPRFHVLDGDARRYLRSAGRPTPNSVVTIRNDEGEILPPGEVGEVCSFSPGSMKAIWGDPDATAARFTPDGAVRTRDLGHLDESGFLYLDDRKDDMIISGGFNVYPAEVENAIASHPAVAEVIVVGAPHEKWGETVVAAVSLREGKAACEEELIEWARERVGPVRKPTKIEFWEGPLPRSPLGKLLRREVRQRYWPEGRQIRGA